MTEFGRDLSCMTGITTGRFVSGARLVAEAIYRRLTTPRGMLRGGEDERNYGLDVCSLVGQSAAPAMLASIPGRIRAEVLKDERVERVEVRVLRLIDGPKVSLRISIRAITGAGPFELQLLATQVDVALLKLEAA